MIVIKVTCLFAVIAAVTAQNGYFGPGRIERQSPMTMGMKMLDDLRNGMQRTFDGIMSRVRPRPTQNRFPPQNRPPQHQFSQAASSPLSRVPPNNGLQRPQFGPHLKEVYPPSPIHKPVTKSSFSVFHEDEQHTPSPVANSDNFNHHPGHSNPADNEIHRGNHHSSFMFHGNQAQAHHLNHDFDSGPYGNNDVEDRNSHFRGSPIVDKYTSSTDGWKVMHSPRPTAPTVSKFKRDQTHQQNDYKKPEKSVKDSHFENTIDATPSSEMDSTNYIENHQPTTPLQPYLRQSSSGNRPRVPPHPQRVQHKRPFLPRQSVMSNRERSPNTNSRENLPQRHFKQQGPSRTRLVNTGYKMEMSPTKDEEEMEVNGYEFGYGLVDDQSGNSFYHAEKKKDGTTKGSYKVQLPDGRVQTVKYTADKDGFQPDVTFKGEPKYPTPK